MSNVMSNVMRLAVTLSYKENLPVFTSVVLMSRRPALGRELADLIAEERGGLKLSLQVHIAKRWEQPAATVLNGGGLEIPPMVGGTKATPEEKETAVQRIEAVEDREVRPSGRKRLRRAASC